jgi:hypothetical protein
MSHGTFLSGGKIRLNSIFSPSAEVSGQGEGQGEGREDREEAKQG